MACPPAWLSECFLLLWLVNDREVIGLIHAQSTTKVRRLIVKTPKGLMGPIFRREALKLLWSLFWDYNWYSETVPKVLFDFTVDPSLCKLFIVYCNVLIGAFISIFPNELKAPQGWKLWSPLPMGATECVNHYPAILHLLYKSTFILLSANCMLGLFCSDLIDIRERYFETFPWITFLAIWGKQTSLQDCSFIGTFFTWFLILIVCFNW